MSDGRKRLSGAEYKKRAKKKLEEQERVLKQTKRLDLFFKTPGEQEIAPVLEGPALDDSVDETAADQLDDNVSAGPSCSNPPANLASLNEDIIIPHEIATESLSLELLSPCCSSEDPAFWVLNDATRDSIAKNGFKQNIDLDFSNSVREYKDQKRYLSKSLFQRTLKNGEVQDRKWMVFSKSKGSVYCGPCLAFNFKEKSQFDCKD